MNNIIRQIEEGAFDGSISHVYKCTKDQVGFYKNRIKRAILKFENKYGIDRKQYVFSCPGRTEICGNHTDHQNGKVLAATVSLDMIAIVSKSKSTKVNIKSEGFAECNIDLSISINEYKQDKNAMLVYGVINRFNEMGFSVGGFDAYIHSCIPVGLGISSSAAYEVLLGTIVNNLYCNMQVSPIKIAQIGQYAENTFLNKPSGLMDQLTCSLGGCLKIDFDDPILPKWERINIDIEKMGYKMYLIDTHSSHENLTEDYSSIPSDMLSIASFFGKTSLRELSYEEFEDAIPKIRKKVGDRAVLRAIHFFEENDRVDKAFTALKEEDVSVFMQNVLISGLSSCCNLQNIHSPSNPKSQGVALTLSLCSKFLKPIRGVWRVHGGGFAGSVQAFVPKGYETQFCKYIEKTLGEGSCIPLKTRLAGSIKLID